MPYSHSHSDRVRHRLEYNLLTEILIISQEGKAESSARGFLKVIRSGAGLWCWGV